MKAIMFGAQSIMLGENDCVMVGGMENMSQTPFYLNGVRTGHKLGDFKTIDGMVKDGLWDVYNNYHMGNAAELCASDCNISREQQDGFAIESYKRSAAAWEAGRFKDEVVPVEVPQRRGDPKIIDTDEEFSNVILEKIPKLRGAFQKDGTVTAANASSINDGAAAMVLMSKEKMNSLGLKPLAKILGYGDAALAPEYFTKAPSKAIPKALKRANLSIEDIDYWEINEAFSVVSLANLELLGLDPVKVDVNGGAVALGHPLGTSGARIVVTLIHVLKQNSGKYGASGICNGGGGASAMVIENI